MYDDFARVYDELMKEIDYHEWADYLFRLTLNAPNSHPLYFGVRMRYGQYHPGIGSKKALT